MLHTNDNISPSRPDAAPTESIDFTEHSNDLSDLANDGSDVEHAFSLDENTSPNLMLHTNDNISPSRPDAAAVDALLMLPSHAAPYQSVQRNARFRCSFMLGQQSLL
jgi:hypothetical protein